MSLQEPPRFSANSNLMNYSIPKNNETTPLKVLTVDYESNKREIQKGDSDTRTRQLEAQIEQLTLQNVKLQRTNRLLKVDTDNLIEQKTSPLQKTIEELTIANVKLQRASRLLQLELEEKVKEINTLKQNQIFQMKNVGPEYEFLVQNINLLQRQIAGHPLCDDTCCFTMEPIDQSTMVMTLPSTDQDSDSDEDQVEAQHICRPVIHSSISQGSYAVELENKIHRLEQYIDEMDQEKEQIVRQQSYKDNDLETLKKELRIKDEIVSQLEQDFMGLEDQIEHLQKELQDQATYTSNNSNGHIRNLLTPPPMIQSDPKRQSQLLMQSKRRSLAIKDTDLLEQMLRGDLEGFDPREDEDEYDDNYVEYIHTPSDNEEEEVFPTERQTVEEKETQELEPLPIQPAVIPSPEVTTATTTESCLTCNGFPCTFPCSHLANTRKTNDPFAFVTGLTIILSFASQLGITDDWTVPITLATLVSTFLWTGNKKKSQANVYKKST